MAVVFDYLCSFSASVPWETSGVHKRVVFKKGAFGGCSLGTKTRNEGTFGCSPGTKTGTRVRSYAPPERKTGTRVHSPKPPFYETALLFPLEKSRESTNPPFFKGGGVLFWGFLPIFALNIGKHPKQKTGVTKTGVC